MTKMENPKVPLKLHWIQTTLEKSPKVIRKLISKLSNSRTTKKHRKKCVQMEKPCVPCEDTKHRVSNIMTETRVMS